MLSDQVAVAVSLGRLIQTVERSERVAQQNAVTVAEQTCIVAEQTRTVSQLVDMVKQSDQVSQQNAATSTEQSQTVSQLVDMVNRLLAARGS